MLIKQSHNRSVRVRVDDTWLSVMSAPDTNRSDIVGVLRNAGHSEDC